MLITTRILIIKAIESILHWAASVVQMGIFCAQLYDPIYIIVPRAIVCLMSIVASYVSLSGCMQPFSPKYQRIWNIYIILQHLIAMLFNLLDLSLRDNLYGISFVAFIVLLILLAIIHIKLNRYLKNGHNVRDIFNQQAIIQPPPQIQDQKQCAQNIYLTFGILQHYDGIQVTRNLCINCGDRDQRGFICPKFPQFKVHMKCLQQWNQQNPLTCPLCKQKLQPDIVPVVV